MKKKILFLLFLLTMALVFVTSCSKDDDDTESLKEQSPVMVNNSGDADFKWLDEKTFAFNGIQYKLSANDKSKVTVIKYYGQKPTGELIIPSSIKTKNVTYIVVEVGEQAFYQCQGITALSLGDSITIIGEQAFAECSEIIKVLFPNQLDEIRQSAFEGCERLQSLNFPQNLTAIYGDAFNRCKGLTSVYIPSNVKSLGDYYNPNFVTGNSWEEESNIEAAFKRNPFSRCENLTSLKVDKNNKVYDSRNNCNAIILSSSDAIVSGCNNSIILDDIRVIGAYAFCDCKKLAAISLPNGLEQIWQYAFSGCNNLPSVDIPNTVKTIGNAAFEGCSLLVSAKLPDNIKIISKEMFANCTNLSKVIVSEKTEIIGEAAFKNCRLSSITFPKSLCGIGKDAFKNCSPLTSLIFPYVAVIEEGAFCGCPNITSITISYDTPPTNNGNSNMFDEDVYTNATLYVPLQSVEIYKNSPDWKKFKHIISEVIVFEEETIKIMPNDTKQLKYTITYDNLVVESVKWSIENPSVATIDSEGNLTAKDYGTTNVTININDGKYIASCIVSVVKITDLVYAECTNRRQNYNSWSQTWNVSSGLYNNSLHTIRVLEVHCGSMEKYMIRDLEAGRILSMILYSYTGIYNEKTVRWKWSYNGEIYWSSCSD